MSLESERLVEQVFRYLDGEQDAVIDWLVKLGCTITIPGDSLTAPVLRGATGITGSLQPSDPVSVAAQMGFMLFGEYWPFVVPTMLKEVGAEWKRRGGKLPPKERKEKTVAEKGRQESAENEQLSFLTDSDA